MFTTLVENYCLYLPLALGAYLSFTVLNVADLSIESAYLMGALVAWKISLLHLDSFTSLCAGLGAAGFGGALVGIVSSLITRFCGVAQVLSGIIVIGLVHGIAYFVLQGAHHSITRGSTEIPILIIIVGTLCILTLLFLRTQLGYAVSIYGINPLFFKYHKISEGFVYSTGLAISNGLAGISGFLIAQSHGFVDLSMAQGIPLMGLCILMIGSFFVSKSAFNVPLVPLIGTIGYLLLQYLVLRAGITSYYFTLVESGVVLLGLILTQWMRKLP